VAGTQAPETIDLSRDRDLKGRAGDIWVRRGLFSVIVAIVVLALFNVFGQKPSTSRADSAKAALEVYTPSRVRGGLMFESRFTINAHQDMATPKLVLDPGWFESMTINSLEPSPSSETSRNGKMVLTFDSLRAGQKLVFWAFFQVNPTNVGRRSTGVELDDGNEPLLHIARKVTIFP
jgi:hypothetical protein